jgi:hypothetical protein
MMYFIYCFFLFCRGPFQCNLIPRGLVAKAKKDTTTYRHHRHMHGVQAVTFRSSIKTHNTTRLQNGCTFSIIYREVA